MRRSDLDAAGVVDNAVLLTLLEQARFACFGHLGRKCSQSSRRARIRQVAPVP